MKKKEIRRVKAGELTFADLASDDTVYAVDLAKFYTDIGYGQTAGGITYELGKILKKNARNSIVAFLQESGIDGRQFKTWLGQFTVDGLYKTLCTLDNIGHTTAVLFTVAMRGELPSLTMIIANAIHDTLFIAPAQTAADESLSRIRSSYFGEYDTRLDSHKAYDCALRLFDAYAPTLKLRNLPSKDEVMERAFNDDLLWFDGSSVMDKRIKEAEEFLMTLNEMQSEAIVKEAPDNADDDQKKAFSGILSAKRLCVLSGIPGSGKSQLIRWLYDAYGCEDVLITSYTNKACVVLNQRIPDYSLGGVRGIRSILSTAGLADNNPKFSEALHKVRLLIVDESSFLSSNSLRRVLNILKHCTDKCRLLLVGDPDQLPPVQEYGRPFVMLCRFAEALGVDMFKLEKFHRADAMAIYDSFIELRHAGIHPVTAVSGRVEIVRAKKAETAIQRLCNAYEVTRKETDSVTIIAETNALCNEINKAIALKAYGGALDYRVGGCESRHIIVNKPGMRAVVCDNFRINGQVVLAKNEFVNILASTAEGILVQRRIDNTTVRLSTKQANELLQVGYATTVHKSQGSEEDIVYYIFDGEANRSGAPFSCMKELKYVANSRARQLLRIIVIDSHAEKEIDAPRLINVRTIDSPQAKMYIEGDNNKEN